MPFFFLLKKLHQNLPYKQNFTSYEKIAKSPYLIKRRRVNKFNRQFLYEQVASNFQFNNYLISNPEAFAHF